MKRKLRRSVFWPVSSLIVVALGASLLNPELFQSWMVRTNRWILAHFDWLFNITTFAVLLFLTVIGLSRIGRVTIGGPSATRLFSPWRYFAITVCTTIAAGILFWSTSEPLFHTYEPPPFANVEHGSEAARSFAMSTMYMHWTFSPYGIYTLISLVFAIGYYNLGRPYSLSALIDPFARRKSSGLAALLDAVCLFALVAGMAASLGAGILTLAGGLDSLLGWSQSGFLLGGITTAIVISFVASSISGLFKGIRILSEINLVIFVMLIIYVVCAVLDIEVLSCGWAGLKVYFHDFVQTSIGHYGPEDRKWTGDWTVFYWANWMAWAPLTGMFLGRISRGYQVRELILFVLVLPSLFVMIWMIVFGAGTLIIDARSSGQLYQLLLDKGPQSIVYAFFDQMAHADLLSIVFLFILFISYVTAADSNTLVMSRISSTTLQAREDGQNQPQRLKIFWGCSIGFMAWIMIRYAGVDGIRILSTLGGFPALFVVLAALWSGVRFLKSSTEDLEMDS